MGLRVEVEVGRDPWSSLVMGKKVLARVKELEHLLARFAPRERRRFLRELLLYGYVTIPHRVVEGYSLSFDVVKKMLERWEKSSNPFLQKLAREMEQYLATLPREAKSRKELEEKLREIMEKIRRDLEQYYEQYRKQLEKQEQEKVKQIEEELEETKRRLSEVEKELMNMPNQATSLIEEKLGAFLNELEEDIKNPEYVAVFPSDYYFNNFTTGDIVDSWTDVIYSSPSFNNVLPNPCVLLKYKSLSKPNSLGVQFNVVNIVDLLRDAVQSVLNKLIRERRYITGKEVVNMVFNEFFKRLEKKLGVRLSESIKNIIKHALTGNIPDNWVIYEPVYENDFNINLKALENDLSKYVPIPQTASKEDVTNLEEAIKEAVSKGINELTMGGFILAKAIPNGPFPPNYVPLTSADAYLVKMGRHWYICLGIEVEDNNNRTKIYLIPIMKLNAEEPGWVPMCATTGTFLGLHYPIKIPFTQLSNVYKNVYNIVQQKYKEKERYMKLLNEESIEEEQTKKRFLEREREKLKNYLNKF